METYVLDASALVDIYRHFRNKFRKLKPLVASGHIKIPEGVFRELHRVTGELYKTVKIWIQDNSDCLVQIGRVHNLANEFVRIERQYGERIRVGKHEHPGLWKSHSGRKAADSQVIATAKILKGIVVSDDYGIRLVCMLEGIPCISWTEFVRQVKSLQPNQLRLLLDDQVNPPDAG